MSKKQKNLIWLPLICYTLTLIMMAGALGFVCGTYNFINKSEKVSKVNKSETPIIATVTTHEETIPITSSVTRKPYMDYRTVTDTTSRQWELLHREEVIHNDDGTISLDGYVFAALGANFGDIGERYIVTLKKDDGTKTTIKIIKADEKQNEHTLNGEGWVGQDGHVLEMIVDEDKLPDEVKVMGDCNYLPLLEGEITEIYKEVK